MNKAQAEFVVEQLTKILSNRNLLHVAVGPLRPGGEIRQDERFDKAYIVEHSPEKCHVATCDSYGVMTGAEHYEFNPRERSITAKTTNGYGETLYFTYAVQFDSHDRDSEWNKARQELQEAEANFRKVRMEPVVA